MTKFNPNWSHTAKRVKVINTPKFKGKKPVEPKLIQIHIDDILSEDEFYMYMSNKKYEIILN